ncbi:MAG: class I SAM-dependent methyltransferase [Vulcanimicrobiaceae bacterium]
MERIPAFARHDESPDERFYREPRFVTHIDDRAIDAVTELYRERLPAAGRILDLMSSWVSHLPPEIPYASVVGIGLNERELSENPRLDAYLVHDLNVDPELPFDEAAFDGATICVSVQYLTRPIAVLREVARVLRPGAPLVITFSNRCFPTKAVAIWQALSDRGHSELIERYLVDAGGWEAIEAHDRTAPGGDPLYAVVARRAA